MTLLSRLRTSRISSSRTIPLVLVAAAFVGAAACGSSTGDAGPRATEPPTVETTTTSTAPPGPVADQTQPKGIFGLAFHDNKVWMADFYSGQVLAVDPDSGAILKRFKAEDGVPEEVCDVAVGPDGTVYWTGFNDGQVGRMTTANVNSVIGGVEAGACGIASAESGKLYAGRSTISDGLWEIDPNAEKKERKIADKIGNVKGFAIGPDGFIYGARYGHDGAGTLIKVDPTPKGDPTEAAATPPTEPVIAAITELATGFSGPVSVKLSPDGTRAFVLSQAPASGPSLVAVDLATKAVTPLPGPQTALVGGMTVAPDGRIFVSGYNEPVLNVISPDGTVKTIGVGRR